MFGNQCHISASSRTKLKSKKVPTLYNECRYFFVASSLPIEAMVYHFCPAIIFIRVVMSARLTTPSKFMSPFLKIIFMVAGLERS